MSKKTVLLNLGTPHAPTSDSVGEYLDEFLMDKYIIDIPFIFRWILVKWLIVPRRKFASSQLYKSIWTDQGSPLRYLSEDFADKVSRQLAEPVVLKMRYQDDYRDLENSSDEIDLVPLYPHYAEATVRSSVEYILGKIGKRESVRILKPYFANSIYIDCLVKSIKEAPGQLGADPLVFSYHGLPISQIKKTDFSGHCQPETKGCCEQISRLNQNCYRAHCEATTRLVAKKLNHLNSVTAFQSRFGRAKWLEPSTQSTLVKMAQSGIKRVSVIAPSFSVDGLETLQEIEMELREEFMANGGEEFNYIRCLNSNEVWVDGFVQILSKKENWLSASDFELYMRGKFKLD